MRIASYTDDEGRRWAVQLPDGVPDSDAKLGLPLGPPPLASLGLPKETEIRLHNQLFDRRIFTAKDAKRRRQDVFAALQNAFSVDAGRVIDLYLESASV